MTNTQTKKRRTKAEIVADEVAALHAMGAFRNPEVPNLDEDTNEDEPVLDADAELAAEAEIRELEADEGEEASVVRSVVKGAYKAKYAARGEEVRKTKGFTKKAAKRSCSDWLAQQLGIRTLDDKAKLIVPKLEAILDANGVKHDHWNRTTKGWQGRLRMTGRLALQRVVAESGELVIDANETVRAPASWVAQHQR